MFSLISIEGFFQLNSLSFKIVKNNLKLKIDLKFVIFVKLILRINNLTMNSNMKIIFMFFLLGIILSEADNKKVPKKKLTRLEKE